MVDTSIYMASSGPGRVSRIKDLSRCSFNTAIKHMRGAQYRYE